MNELSFIILLRFKQKLASKHSKNNSTFHREKSPFIVDTSECYQILKITKMNCNITG